MRLRNIAALFLIPALALSVLWCVGPCCGTMGASADQRTSVSAVACCGEGAPAQCQPTIQRAEAATLASLVAPQAPLADLTGFGPSAVGDRQFRNAARPSPLPPRFRRDLLQIPLLI